MRIEFTLAVCAALVAAGRLIDDYYISDAGKVRFAEEIDYSLRRISGLELPRLVAEMNMWLVSRRRTTYTFCLGLSISVSIYINLLSLIMYSAQRGSAASALMNFAYVALFIATFLILFASTKTIYALVQWFRPNYAVMYTTLICISCLILTIIVLNFTAQEPMPIFVLALWMLCVAFLIAMIAIVIYLGVIPLVLLLRISIISADFTAKHILKKANTSKKPFAYLGTLASLCVALCKVGSETMHS